MKTLKVLCVVLLAPLAAPAVTWNGSASGDYNNAANWTGGVLPSGNEIAQFNSVGTSASRVITGDIVFNGTSGKIAVGAVTSPYTFGATVGANTITLFKGTTGDAFLHGSATTTLINDHIVLGDGSATTINLTNTETTTGLLEIAGNIAGGTGGTPGAVILAFGSTTTKNGSYAVSGSMTKGGALSLQITKNGTGTLTLSGNNTVINLGNNVAGSTIRITGGSTTIENAAATGWGVATQPTSVVQVSGGSLNPYDSNAVRNSITVDGGALNLGQANNTLGSAGARFSFQTSATPYTLTISGGSVTYYPNFTTNNAGVRLGNSSGPTNTNASAIVNAVQTGGTFTVWGGGYQDGTFSLGTAYTTAGYNNSYTLSGGRLEIRGTDGSNGRIDLGADNAGANTTTFTLTGSGKLVVAGGSTGAGIRGRNTAVAPAPAGTGVDPLQVFAMTGGTLVTGRIDATNLRASPSGSPGNFVNAGGTLAPGDTGTAGLTTITGNFAQTSGTLAIDIGGTAVATSYQTGAYDHVSVSGTAALGGDLSVSLIGGFTPSAADTFTLLTSTGALSGDFANAASGSRLSVGQGGSFLVTRTANSVVLSDYRGAVTDYSGAYFGTLAGGGHWALRVRADRTATFLAYLSGRQSAIVANLTVNADGTFTASGTEIVATVSGAFALGSPESPRPRTAAAAASFTLAGTVTAGGALTGQLTGIADTLSGSRDAGSARTPALFSAAGSGGSVYAIVGPSGQALVVTATATAVDSASGTVNSSGQLTATTARSAQLSLTVDGTAQTVSATVTPTGGSAVAYSGAADTGGYLSNLSVRAATSASQTLIVGFVVEGGEKPLLVRAAGPVLNNYGLIGVSDPRLALYNGSTLVTQNDDWSPSLASTFATLGAFAFDPSSKDSALQQSVNGPHTAQATVTNSGQILVEAYDAGPNDTRKLTNLSARFQVGTGDNILIAGFVVAGSGTRQVLVRAVGPTLASYGVPNTLADPQFSVFDGGTAIASNNDWSASLSSTFTTLGAFSLDSASKDAALVVTLQAGKPYTVQVSGVGGTTGEALVELYLVP